jgi:hypothetical protein
MSEYQRQQEIPRQQRQQAAEAPPTQVAAAAAAKTKAEDAGKTSYVSMKRSSRTRSMKRSSRTSRIRQQGQQQKRQKKSRSLWNPWSIFELIINFFFGRGAPIGKQLIRWLKWDMSATSGLRGLTYD